MKKSLAPKILSVVLVVALIVSCIPMMVSANTSEIRFGVISDIHYIAPSLKNLESEVWQDFVYNKHKEYNDLDSLVDNALDGVLRNAVEGGENYVLIPGDLTKDGELESHKALAEKFGAFEEETGIQVLVIPGNHDINNSNAVTYENGIKEPTAKTSPEDFREIYADFGFDLADSFFVPEAGKKGGMLSYAATLGNYRLIAIDSCIYSDDNGAENNEHETSGQIAEGLMDWIKAECEEAEENGLTVIGMQHHNLVPHTTIEEATLFAFVVNNWLEVAESYADAGMHYVFTGHLHANNVAKHVSDNGEAVYDILTPSLSGYPNYYKIVDFKTTGDEVTMDMQTLDVDEYQPVVSDYGTVYEQPYSMTYSFGRTFGESGIKDLALGMIEPLIDEYIPAIQEAGGLLEFLKTMNLDIEQLLVDLLGTNGLEFAGVEILTISSNVMGFIKDFANQIDEAYVNNPDKLKALVNDILDQVVNYTVSDLPATMVSEVLGYEIADKCTFGEYALTVVYYYYSGDEDISDYPYIEDVLDRFDSGELAQEIFNLLRKVLITDLIQGELLATLEFNPGELFPDGNIFSIFGKLLQGITETLLGGNNSFGNLIDSVLSLPVVPENYSSLDAIIDHLMNEYLTQSQYESWGYTIRWMLESFMIDNDPGEKMDSNAVITYSGKEEVEVTKDNYRLPSHIVSSLGEDSTSEISITWLTKYSVTGTDIEIVPYSENPKFTGNPTTGKKVDASSEIVSKTYPGADIGLLLTIMPYARDYIKHTIKLSGLESGTKYCYRVGDANRGWWSEVGTIETAAGGDEKFTFFYMTDPQAQRPEHFERFDMVLDTASALYPDGKFIVTAGDHVDMGGNVKHWRYLLNTADKLLNLPLMPTTGNHEKDGAVITENFVLPNVPEQDLDSGVYYSYDYNNVHFTVLNTNDDEDDKLGDAQIEWLKNDIKSSDAKWKIVVLHKALYSNGSHFDDSDIEGFRKQLGTLLPYLGVDLVLQGHDHVYLRTDAMAANAVIPSATTVAEYDGLEYYVKHDPKGTIYSICGTSGVKVYQTKEESETDASFPRAEKLNTENTENSMFSAIIVDGDTLYYNAYEVDDGNATRVDNFAIEKSSGESPSDKAGIFADILEGIITTFDFSFAWQFTNFIVNIVSRVMQFLNIM